MRITKIAALAAVYAGACHAHGERELLERIDALQRDVAALSIEAPAGTLPNTCGAAPLPTTPAGPAVEATWQTANSEDPLDVTAWRIPCSASESMVVLTLRPAAGSNPPFICAVGFTLLQAGGLQTSELNFRTDPPNSSSFCGDVVAPVTVAITPRSNTPASFDFDQAMTIDFDATAGHQTIAIASFDPSQYNLTPPPGGDSVELRVRGTGTHYRNCQVATATIGSAHQYTASCASESPLMNGGFDRYAH